MGTIRDYNHWFNGDNLRLSFGVGEAQVTRGGELASYPGHHVTQTSILGAELALLTDPSIVDYGAVIPKGVHIVGGHMDTETTWVGSSGTLDVGTVLASAAPARTEGDYDGFFEALTIAELTTGLPVFPADGALVGEEVGTDAGGYLISVESNTTTMTAGVSLCSIFWKNTAHTATT